MSRLNPVNNDEKMEMSSYSVSPTMFVYIVRRARLPLELFASTVGLVLSAQYRMEISNVFMVSFIFVPRTQIHVDFKAYHAIEMSLNNT